MCSSDLSVERLAALSDGIFGVAMTLLMLDLRVPLTDSIRGEHDLWGALAALAPQLAMYMMSFLTLGIFWVGQQTQLNHLTRSHRTLTWLHLVFLFCVTMLPFTTKLLAEFVQYRAALIVYWFNVFALGATVYLTWRCAVGLGLVKPEVVQHASRAIERRVVIAQTLYAIGALMCIFSTYASITFILLVQLNYAIAPKFWGRDAAG